MTKTEQSGEKTVNDTPLPTGTDGKSEKLPNLTSQPIEINQDKILSSEDFDDPTLYKVLQWHMSKCAHCTEGMKHRPPEFGVKDTRHCDEYYQIAKEFGEYEVQYAWKGNP